MIAAHRAQRSFADGLIAEEVSDLWEDWMRAADQVLDDEQLLSMVYEALSKRRPQSRTRGRLGTPAEVVLRLLGNRWRAQRRTEGHACSSKLCGRMGYSKTGRDFSVAQRIFRAGIGHGRLPVCHCANRLQGR
jgi:hypothetical protein